VVIAAIVLGAEYRRLVPVLAAFTLLTLYSRPYLGMHHPLDALAGAGVGALVGVAALALRGRWENDPRESA
jgi:membrane-associated phospholipid phosphatase